VDEVIEEANKHSYSRFPIISQRDGHVVGIVSLFELLGLDGGETLSSVMQPPFFANENEPAERVFIRMKEEALHMAVVLGNDGRIRGIVTLEDILECMVGDIASENE
jgi:putative hemolysin